MVRSVSDVDQLIEAIEVLAKDNIEQGEFVDFCLRIRYALTLLKVLMVTPPSYL